LILVGGEGVPRLPVHRGIIAGSPRRMCSEPSGQKPAAPRNSCNALRAVRGRAVVQSAEPEWARRVGVVVQRNQIAKGDSRLDLIAGLGAAAALRRRLAPG
jgi:hypothetical protein